MAVEPKGIAEFYDLLSPDYDSMTGFEKRFVQERPLFKLLVERYKIKTALDAGCGPGFHALLLSELGVRVTAVDASAQMVHLAREHARNRGADIEFVVGTFEDLAKVLKKRFESVFVMGNALAHIVESQDLTRALRNFADLLEPNGILFNILTRAKSGGREEEKLHTIRQKPILQDVFSRQLEEAGFVDVKGFGGITMDAFIPESSKDLVVLARKPA